MATQAQNESSRPTADGAAQAAPWGGTDSTVLRASPLLLVPDEEQDRPGDRVGNYQLIELLGEGTMGRVFRARDLDAEREVAIKIVRPEHSRNVEVLRRFFQEAEAVERVRHENIVKAIDFQQETRKSGLPRAFCVMELLEGESFEHRLRRGACSLGDAVDVMAQVCDALEAAHQLGVVHRDIKPDNIFVTQRGGVLHAKVLDFGVAKLVQPGEHNPNATAVGAIIGTPDYMAPEQAAGRGSDHRTDIYAVGAVLFQALTGHPPHQAKAIGDLLVQIITRPAPALPRHALSGERIPPALRELIASCLSKDPDRRPQSMRLLAHQLRRSLIIRRMSPRWRRVIAATACALGALALGGLLQSQPVPAAVASGRGAAQLEAPAPIARIQPARATTRVRTAATKAQRTPKPAVHRPSRDAVIDAFRD